MISLSNFKSKLASEGSVKWPVAPKLEFFWRFEMKASRASIWAHLSDTSRLNREMGFTRREQVEREGKVYVTTKMLGFTQRWIEEPWTWLAGSTLASHRTYEIGMANHVHSVFHIEEESKSNRRNIYVYFGWKPKNLFWKFFLSATESTVKKLFTKLFEKIDYLLVHRPNVEKSLLQNSPPELTPSALKKVSEIALEMGEKKLNPRVISKLIEFVTTADDLEMEPLRILPLAQEWQMEERELLSVALHATQLGLLKMSWDVVCPHCRGTRYGASSLGEIPEASHCEICEVTFATDDENSVEITFHVHPFIRKAERMMYCAAEPARKNHIRVQQNVEASDTLLFAMKLPAGIYRVRCRGQAGEILFKVSNQLGASELDLSTIGKKLVVAEPVEVGNHTQFKFVNSTTEDTLLIVEELWWQNSILKPSHILALPQFRSLFSEDHLSANVKLFLGEQTILFTDIVGSTDFYHDVGDAKAFSKVREHFKEVFEAVEVHQGVVVKTIGDAVMASFSSTREAMAAAISLQNKFHEARADTSIRLRISVHCGPVIAVHLNTGIDYFGSTVNLAAKIQSCAGPGEIALSPQAYEIYQKHYQDQYPVVPRTNKRDGSKETGVHVVQLYEKATAALA
jgi:hypothetical protein